MEHHIITKNFIDKERFANTTAAIHSNEFCPATLITTGQLCYLLFSTDDCTHIHNIFAVLAAFACKVTKKTKQIRVKVLIFE